LKIVECVPNFSEGRRKEVIDAIANAARSVKGVSVLDCESDANHNRMVLTIAGPPDQVKEAAIASSEIAVKLIDLTKHQGEHPRMGAVDVVPFVPLRGATLEECVKLANEFADEYSSRFQIPVYLYESAAKIPERKDLAKVRKGQFEGLRDQIGKDPSKDPDYGPKKIHPTAGATAVGARMVLIAYNVNLGTRDVSVASRIAHEIRERDGGLPTVKALGFELRDRAMVQVSMNLTNYNVTSILKAFDKVSERAQELGVPVVESEIVGLIPLAALAEGATDRLKIENFSSSQIIENRLLDVVMEDSNRNEDFSKLTIREFADKVASKEPTPGGGTVSAYAGVLASSLVTMVCKLTIGKKGYESQFVRMQEILKENEECTSRLMDLANQDSSAYSKVSKAIGMPKNTEDEKSKRRSEIKKALKEATIVPSETMITCMKVLSFAKDVRQNGNRSATSDSETAIELARAAAKGSWSNVKNNLGGLTDEPEFIRRVSEKLEPLLSEIG
jgi:glutamate formiminotransferase/formiminotetrahydrofolate cyclodeaminase